MSSASRNEQKRALAALAWMRNDPTAEWPRWALLDGSLNNVILSGADKRWVRRRGQELLAQGRYDPPLHLAATHHQTAPITESIE